MRDPFSGSMLVFQSVVGLLPSEGGVVQRFGLALLDRPPWSGSRACFLLQSFTKSTNVPGQTMAT